MNIGTIATSLNKVAEILKKNKICIDTSMISQATQNLNNKITPNSCYYKIERLIFNVPTIPRNSIPSNVKDLKIIFNIEICQVFNRHKDIIINPISKDKDKHINYNCSFTFIGKSGRSNGNVVEVVSGMHFDYDSVSETDFDHPDLHMTFGGNTMLERCKEGNYNDFFGNTLLLTTPRIPHPPMDAVLGIDFILRNFYKKETYNKIKEDSTYRNAIRQSQERLWKPYMLALAGHWCNFTGCKYGDQFNLAKKYNPSLSD